MGEHFTGKEALERLSRAVQIPTVSRREHEKTDFAAFDSFLCFLEDAYPLFHRTLEQERINKYGLIYRWRGKDAGKEPIAMTAHYDVVPAGDPGAWKYPAFSGAIAEGRVWGRGTLDIKSQLTAHMEAVEALIRKGFQPDREIYFIYGQDEEVGTEYGAKAIAALFEQRGIRFAGMLDEGGIVVTGAIRGVKSPIALIGVAEKGVTDFELTVKGAGGHSSMPPKTTALGMVAALITRIEANPMPARLLPTLIEMLKALSVEMGKHIDFLASHPKLFGFLLNGVLSKSAETNAMIRTTLAATMSRGSEASNVLPQSATVTVNARLLPGDTIDSVTRHIQELAGDIPVTIETPLSNEASPVSPTSGPFYERLHDVIADTYPDAIISPYIMSGATDSRRYTAVCKHLYRFTPLQITNAEKDTIHNANESVGEEAYLRMVRFFITFLESW